MHELYVTVKYHVQVHATSRPAIVVEILWHGMYHVCPSPLVKLDIHGDTKHEVFSSTIIPGPWESYPVPAQCISPWIKLAVLTSDFVPRSTDAGCTPPFCFQSDSVVNPAI